MLKLAAGLAYMSAGRLKAVAHIRTPFTMTHPFLEDLAKRPLLADGGIGTLLYARGASPEASFEQLNLTRQDFVQQLHIDYINAGADLIETNSFSGNRFRLQTYGLDDQVWKINVWAAKVARNAREVAGQPVYIAGSIGPTGKLLAPLGDVTADEMSKAFQEQMEALLAGGVDLFMIETMSSLEELALAVRAARKVSKLPVVAQLSFSVEGHTLLGVIPEDVVKLFAELGDEAPNVMGINCGAGPGPVFDCLIRMRNALKSKGLDTDQLPLSCLPNAGQPSLTGGRYTFMSRPDYCASYVEPYARAGARLIGGCCGTTPQHIKSMREMLDRYLDSIRKVSDTTLAQLPAMTPTAPVVVDVKAKDKTKQGEKQAKVESALASSQVDDALPLLASRLATAKANPKRGDFFISVELDPPKGAVARKLLQAAEKLKNAGADAINVGDSPMARVRMSSLATCQLIAAHVNIETIIHFTTRDRNLMGIQADLLGCQALGIHNVIALTGDPPTLGNYVHATAVYDVDSIGLIKIISQLNRGVDIAGNSIGSPTRLSIACALNPTAENRQLERERFAKKIEAGAHFAMTQPIYQVSDLTDFLDEFGPCKIPILVGIMPLHSFKHAEYLHNEVPGITIPQAIRDAMEKAGDEGSAVGLELAEELLEEVRDICQGTYLVPSFGRYDDMCSLVQRLKEKARKESAKR
ncbi:MAG TPA: bifunctional homocysteine S-methyltransferase/methylenetetrahydrofolate reductase [Candidatus Obscuribacterales bacterium]